MNFLTIHISKIIYWLTWPGIYLLVRGSNRTRVLIVQDKKVLLVQGWLNDGRWQLPGGGVKKNEDFKKAASRELIEETGLKIKSPQLKSIGNLSIRENGINYQCHYFLVSSCDMTTLKAGHEIRRCQWFKVIELNKSNSGIDVLEGLKLVNRLAI